MVNGELIIRQTNEIFVLETKILFGAGVATQKIDQPSQEQKSGDM